LISRKKEGLLHVAETSHHRIAYHGIGLWLHVYWASFETCSGCHRYKPLDLEFSADNLTYEVYEYSDCRFTVLEDNEGLARTIIGHPYLTSNR